MGCSLELMNVISRLCDAVLPAEDPQHLSPEHIDEMNGLEEQLMNLEQHVAVVEPVEATEPQDRIETIAELYRIASLIYLKRVARRIPHDDPKVRALVREGLSRLEKLGSCRFPWPLFIIATEARTDIERALILDVFQTTQRIKNLENVAWARKMVEAAWKQDDLHTEQEADQLIRYNAVMSAWRILPSLI